MKSIQDYAGEKERTETLNEFIEWVEAEAGLEFASQRQKAAFERGLCLGVRGYHLFQKAKRGES